MNMSLKLAGVISVGLALTCAYARAQAGDVSVHLAVTPHAAVAAKQKAHNNLSETVVWLTAVDAPGAKPAVKGTYRMLQKNKQFSPHLLVIPTGSSVEFPNQDPFFHNVFSLYNGKAFDLGLYESGTKRAVPFDREGLSYIFCNIHPEMGAIVLTVSTPYYATAKEDGSVSIRDVAPGRYRLHIWSQGLQPTNDADARRVVQVTEQGAALGNIELSVAADPMAHHKNKFGEDYPAAHPAIY